MQPSTARTFGTHTVPLFDRMSVPFGKNLLLSAPSFVTLSLVSDMNFPGALVTSEIIIQGISPPKNLVSPLGRGEAPLITSVISDSLVHFHPSGSDLKSFILDITPPVLVQFI